MSRIMMIKCDRCGCEIHTKCTYRMMAYVTELDGKKCIAQPYEAEMEREYCDSCLTDILDYMHKKPGSKGKNSKPAARQKLDIGKVLALKKAGWSNAKIADELGVSAATVGSCLKRNGVEDA